MKRPIFSEVLEMLPQPQQNAAEGPHCGGVDSTVFSAVDVAEHLVG